MGDPKSAAQDDVEKGNGGKDKSDAAPSGGDDPSVKIWHLSLARTSEHDAGMVDRWKGDMDGILIYTGIFSATVAAFLIESYKSLKPDPSDVSSRLLQQIAQELAGLSVGGVGDLEPFRPQRALIHVNILWFLSLCLSLACGLFATLVQQWLRRYIRLTQLSDDPIIRVRIRTFLFKGIHGFHVRSVVENVSVMLHAAIFLFLTGLVEFLFAFNDEVADVILVAVSVIAAVYICVTFLPLIYRHCPYQTPLTMILWYIGHCLAIASLSLVRCSGQILPRVKKLQTHISLGLDRHLLGMMGDEVKLDKAALEATLNMCRDDNDLEAFMDAIPGYLQAERNSDTHKEPDVVDRIKTIGSLLRTTEKDSKEMQLRHRLVNLFAFCTKDHRSMDEKARRRRAIICSRAIWEVSKASLPTSTRAEGVTLNLPDSIRQTINSLTCDTDSEIAAAALRTQVMFKRAFREQPAEADADAHKEKGHDPIKDMVAALPEVNPEIPPPLTPSPSYHVEQRNYKPSDERLKTVTEYTLGILALIPQLEKPSHMDLEETRLTFKELCRGLNGQNFSRTDQECVFNVLNRTAEAHSKLRQKLRTAGHDKHLSEQYYLTIKSSTGHLVSALHDEFAGPLRQVGFSSVVVS